MRLNLSTFDHGDNALWSVDGRQVKLALTEGEYSALKDLLRATGSTKFSVAKTDAEAAEFLAEGRASGFSRIGPRDAWEPRWFQRCALWSGVEIADPVASAISRRLAGEPGEIFAGWSDGVPPPPAGTTELEVDLGFMQSRVAVTAEDLAALRAARVAGLEHCAVSGQRVVWFRDCTPDSIKAIERIVTG